MKEIETQHLNPPIPNRSWDWCAFFKGYEPGEPIGYGPTEQQAIDDLLGETK